MKQVLINMKRLKIVKRIGMPETNSSSSHSLIISMDKDYIDVSNNLEFDENNNIVIPKSTKNFSSRFENINNTLLKIYYVCGHCLGEYNLLPILNRRVYDLLKKVIIDYTGANDVIFEALEGINIDDPFPPHSNDIELIEQTILAWEEVGNSEPVGPNIYYLQIPQIENDDNLFYLITESETSMKDFLFNPKSFIITSGDYLDLNPMRLNNLEEPEAILSMYFPDEIGKVDFEIHKLSDKILQDVVSSNNFWECSYNSAILSNIRIDKHKKNAFICSEASEFNIDENLLTLSKLLLKLTNSDKIFKTDEGKIFIPAVTKRFGKSFWADYYELSNDNGDEKLEVNSVKLILENTKNKYPEDYMDIRVTLTSNTLGEIWKK